jgi:hypothetical protein
MMHNKLGALENSFRSIALGAKKNLSNKCYKIVWALQFFCNNPKVWTQVLKNCSTSQRPPQMKRHACCQLFGWNLPPPSHSRTPPCCRPKSEWFFRRLVKSSAVPMELSPTASFTHWSATELHLPVLAPLSLPWHAATLSRGEQHRLLRRSDVTVQSLRDEILCDSQRWWLDTIKSPEVDARAYDTTTCSFG